MSYQLPNGQWVSVQGGYNQRQDGAWGGASGGSPFAGRDSGLQGSNFFYSGASSSGSSGLLSNGREYVPYTFPSEIRLPPVKGCNRPPFDPRPRRDGY
jgi:hypothetical protein